MILTKILIDIDSNKILDKDEYLNLIDLNVAKKEKIAKFFDFSIRNGLISKSSLLFKSSVWYRSRLFMTLSTLLRSIFIACFCFPFIYINSFINSTFLTSVIEFYLVFNLVIHIHELSHAISYWKYQNQINGYFSYNSIHCLFVYNSKNLSSYQNRVISLSGMIVSCLTICIMHILFNIGVFVIIINILLQIALFFIGTDFAIFRDTL